MPIFEYRCSDCGKVFEDLVISDNEKVTCPDCKSANCSRLISLISSKGLSSMCSDCQPSKCGGKCPHH